MARKLTNKKFVENKKSNINRVEINIHYLFSIFSRCMPDNITTLFSTGNKSNWQKMALILQTI